MLGAIEAISQIGGRAGLRPLLRFLRRDGQQPSITIAALQVVSRYAHEDATATITRLADHPVPQIREVVCIALGRIGDPRSQQTLSRLVTDSSWSVRAGAAHALGSLGKPRLLSPLAKALRDSNRYVRVDAARALGRCGLPQAAPHLADRLGREPDPTVRRALVRGLEQLGRPEAVPAILPMLTDPQPDVRAAAAHALGGLDATQSLLHLYRALEDTAPGVRYAAAHSLARLGPTIGLALAERRLERERDPAICLWLEALLLRSQRDARDGKTLISALNQAGPLRLVATQALAVAGHQPALTPILRLLSGATPEEQTVYISALGQLGGSKAVTPLRLMLEQNQARTGFLKKLSLIKALGRLAHAEATSALTRILNQEPQSWPLDGWQAVQLRLAALWSLSRINSKGAVDGLLSAWNDTNPQVRRRAASLLVTLGVRIRQQLETRLKQARGGKKLWLASVLARLR